jgi:hypothetical protein
VCGIAHCITRTVHTTIAVDEVRPFVPCFLFIYSLFFSPKIRCAAHYCTRSLSRYINPTLGGISLDHYLSVLRERKDNTTRLARNLTAIKTAAGRVYCFRSARFAILQYFFSFFETPGNGPETGTASALAVHERPGKTKTPVTKYSYAALL